MDEELYHASSVYPNPDRWVMPGDSNFEVIGKDLGRQLTAFRRFLHAARELPYLCILRGHIGHFTKPTERTKLDSLVNGAVGQLPNPGGARGAGRRGPLCAIRSLPRTTPTLSRRPSQVPMDYCSAPRSWGWSRRTAFTSVIGDTLSHLRR
jgi:hypothetical protein